MTDNRNYQKELDKILEKLSKENKRPTLLLHSCCAPCSSYCLWYLSRYFDITVLFYNPNISPESEYFLRAEELERLIKEMPGLENVRLIVEKYDHKEFLEKIKGHEKDPERGERCTICYEMRLRKAAEYAKVGGYEYFTTTLSISPYKDARRLVSLGEKIADELGIKYLVSDFKKKEGYKKSIEFSEEYSLYRQDYCGCIFSKTEKENIDKYKK
ncbi:MAG: epoxyqueuosine reductase QueH [Clostridiales bacterium]|nr:epoxyqueuosine reductase QueH [Clostridiales bacterium]